MSVCLSCSKRWTVTTHTVATKAGVSIGDQVCISHQRMGEWNLMPADATCEFHNYEDVDIRDMILRAREARTAGDEPMT